MGVSTDGQISYGVVIEEGYEFPWDVKHEDDLEDWWRRVNGFEDLHDPWTAEGGYADGWSREDPRFKDHYAHRHEWESHNPLPIELINYCSGDVPMYVIAIPDTGKICYRGCPTVFDPASLVVTDQQRDNLLAFLEKWSIKHGEPGWVLTSYWG